MSKKNNKLVQCILLKYVAYIKITGIKMNARNTKNIDCCKVRGRVTRTIYILVGTNHLWNDRRTCCHLRWTVSVVNW